MYYEPDRGSLMQKLVIGVVGLVLLVSLLQIAVAWMARNIGWILLGVVLSVVGMVVLRRRHYY